ncbi:hypothetical protein DFH06DRAFT_1427648 [Mycena polygramma]|nr:hypothetical protein DFH06DRAFT_1427648 [Mycena polygramma]
MQLCFLSALLPDEAGPSDFASDEEETATAMAAEIVEILGHGLSASKIKKILLDSLMLFLQSNCWLQTYTGRKGVHDSIDNFYYMGVVIGPQTDGGEVEFRRVTVEDFLPDDEIWNALVVDSADGKEERIRAITRYGFRGNASKFCWERPYRYFEDWMRHSCPPVAFWDSKTFAEQFFGLLKLKSDWRVYSQVGSDQTDCFAMAAYHELIPGVAYGGIEKTMDDGYQFILENAREGSANTAAAIAAGLRGEELWPAFALDFGAWMMTRPDLWPERPSELVTTGPQFESEGLCVLHGLPLEVLVQILPLLPLADLRSILLLSRGVFELVAPLLEEVLWHHVHYGDLGWILPVSRVADEVDRANTALLGWYPKPAGLACALDSREFPFSRFIPVCFKSDSMRNRHRLWKIYKQYRALWEEKGFEI